MTTVERLIKNICEQERVRLHHERDAQLSKLVSEVPFRQVPGPVRNAFKALQKAARIEKTARKVIERHGFSANHYGNDGDIPDEVRVKGDMADKAKHKLREQYDQKFRELENLRTSAHVMALGKTPEKSRTILVDLQKKVAKL
jgi:hypothetical protein